MDKTDRLRDYGLAFLLYEQSLGVCGYELIRELFIFVKLILNSYLGIYNDMKKQSYICLICIFALLALSACGSSRLTPDVSLGVPLQKGKVPIMGVQWNHNQGY